VHDVAGTAIRSWDSRNHQFRATCDQLRRPVKSYVREGNGPEVLVARSVHGETQPDAELANLRGKVAQHFDQTGVIVSDRYDVKGQRELIAYGNGVSILYRYDSLTFRLMRLTTTRAPDETRLQDLSYTYDPAGNITRIEDGTQQTVYFSNEVAQPRSAYTYDAV